MTKAEFLADQAASLKRQRAELGLTRREVADGIGVSETSIAMWEQQRGVMSAYSALLLQFFFRRKQQERGRKAKASGAAQ